MSRLYQRNLKRYPITANWLWRLFGTGLSFVVFGLTSFLLGALVFPAVCLFYRNKQRRRVVARRTINRAMKFFIGVMSSLGLLSYSVDGREKINQEQGGIIIANHPSLIDVVFLLAIFDDADCVIKEAMWSNIMTRWIVRAADYIHNGDPVEVIEQSIVRLRNGGRLVLFPEGTRTVPGTEPDFKRGAAVIALRAGVPCLPVAIRCEPATLTKAAPWYAIPEHPVRFKITILEWIDTQMFVGAYSALVGANHDRTPSQALNRHIKTQIVRALETPA
jgi:1-acyl-sn-glycerol-3-phosphate acyltransferase